MPGSPSPTKLTQWTSCGGCAAKWGGGPLRGLISELAATTDASLLVGLGLFDDAAVYQLTDDLALVSTTDFFPPLVDDPADFGAIAAANACSDVFAMGGRVVLALNIAAFPEELPLEVAETILQAAAEMVSLAGGSVAGGHTIRSPEPIFGLAVQGTVDPRRVWSKGGSRPGDQLLLSKPLGTGIVLAGGGDQDKAAAVTGMRTLNRRAAADLAGSWETGGVHAVTDVTGFGLAGHSWEMAERSSVEVVIDTASLPLYPATRALAEAGVKTGGEARNRGYLGEHLTVDGDGWAESVALDPQTSGGLLAAVDGATAARLRDLGWWQVGSVEAGPPRVRLA
ncbi:MAG: selenide, water dikinase SelD [Acidobacteriota bacterium]|nr:selenide, water dikinase SelD [Acidobacteriota bacterium]